MDNIPAPTELREAGQLSGSWGWGAGEAQVESGAIPETGAWLGERKLLGGRGRAGGGKRCFERGGVPYGWREPGLGGWVVSGKGSEECLTPI